MPSGASSPARVSVASSAVARAARVLRIMFAMVLCSGAVKGAPGMFHLELRRMGVSKGAAEGAVQGAAQGAPDHVCFFH